jgi:uncharacterized protein YqjF (DUF2071 family)
MIKPTLDMRLEVRERPTHRAPVMYQKWQELLFLHWEFNPQTIQRTLPTGLYVDTFEDRAYLGVVPFFMKDVRPRFFPAVPGVSNFQELNVRTYVHDSRGSPGVWFYSLDANQYLAVKAARFFFSLPYFYAKMKAGFNPVTKEVSYSSHRRGTDAGLKTFFKYRPTSDASTAAPGTLEFFLVERYILFAYSGRGKLYSGRVWHRPYQLAEVEVSDLNESVLRLDGFSKPAAAPDHKIMSPGVEVDIFGLREVT